MDVLPRREKNGRRPLTDTEVERLANRVVWPFVDRVVGHDFKRRPVGESRPNQVLLDPTEDWPKNTLRLIVSAHRVAKDNHYRRLKSGESVSVAQITAEQAEPELTRPMHRAYTESILSDDTLFSESESLRSVMAWRVNEFWFKRHYSPDGRRLSWLAWTALKYELQTKKDGIAICSDRSIFGQDDEEEPDPTIDELNMKIHDYSINMDDVGFLVGAINRVQYGEGFSTEAVRR